MKASTKTRQLTILGLLTGILLLMAYTPLGYLNIGLWLSRSTSSLSHWLPLLSDMQAELPREPYSD